MVAEITHQTAGYEDALSVGLQSESSGDESALDLQNFPRVKVEDRELLQEEEERKKLLSPRTRHNAQSSVAPFSPQDRRRTQRKPSSSKQNSRRGRRRPYEKGELMYKLEEGGLRDDASPQSSSSSLDLDRAKNGITSTSKVGGGRLSYRIKLIVLFSAQANNASYLDCRSGNDTLWPSYTRSLSRVSSIPKWTYHIFPIERVIQLCPYNHSHLP